MVIVILSFKAGSAISMSIQSDSVKNASDLIQDAERAVALIVKSGLPSQMDHMQPEMDMQDFQQFDQPEMIDNSMDYDMGGFDDW